MYAIILIAFAAICKAVADTLQHHYERSIFSYEDPKFWNPSISWQYAPFVRFTKYRLDAWHLFNTGMQGFFIAAVFAYEPTMFGRWIDFFACSGVVVLVFNLFYNRLLLRK
jgi:hypothetical protein